MDGINQAMAVRMLKNDGRRRREEEGDEGFYDPIS